MSEFLRDFASSLQDAATNGGDTSGGGTSGLLAGADAGLRPVPKNLDDATAAGLVDTTVDFGKGFAKGVAKTGSDIDECEAIKGLGYQPDRPMDEQTRRGCILYAVTAEFVGVIEVDRRDALECRYRLEAFV